MTINTDLSKRIYAGNSVTTQFDYDFKIFVESDLAVSLISVDGTETIQVLNTDYTVSGAGFEAGGKVTFVTAPPVSTTVLIISAVPYTQPTDYKNQGRFFPETHENSYDRATRQLLQLKEAQDRSITIPAYLENVSTALAAPEANSVLGWNSQGDAIQNFSLSDIATAATYANKLYQTFTGNGVQTVFTLNADPGSLGNLEISIDGVMQVPVVDFNYLATALTFVVAPNNGSVILVRYDVALPTGITDASAVNFTQAGAGAVASNVLVELRNFLRPEQFGAVGDGVVDDVIPITAAINQASARGGGTVLLDAKDYLISSKLSVPSGVKLHGFGSGQYPPAAMAGSVNFVVTPKTRLLAKTGFPAGTPMVEMAVVRGDNYAIQAAGIRGVMLDCNDIAEQGLRWRAVKNSYVDDVLIFRPTTAATSFGWIIDCGQGAITGATAQAGGAASITLAATSSYRDNHYNGATITITGGTGAGQSKTITGYVGSTRVATVNSNWATPPNGTSVYDITGEVAESNGATQFNEISNVTVWLGNTGNAAGIVWDGDGIHDVNQNNYRNVQVVHANGPGLRFYNGDTDYFYGIRTYAFGNGWGGEFYGSDTTNYEGFCRDEIFFGCLFGGANAGADSGTAQAGAASTITLRAGASATTDYYKNKFVTITANTGVGQRRRITAYNGSTKVATVDSNWTTNPDATSAYTVNGGGGVVLFKGTYRTSRFHTFDGYESGANGAGAIYAEDGGAYAMTTETNYDLADTDGFEINLTAANAFATGTSSRLNFRRRLLGQLQEMSSIRELTTGTEASPTSALAFFSRVAGAAPAEVFRIGDGIQVGGGTQLRKLLRAAATLDFGSVPANSYLNGPSTITVTGAAVNDQVVIGLSSGGVANGLTFKGWVSGADTVTLQALNVTTGAIDPGSLAFSVTVLGW